MPTDAESWKTYNQNIIEQFRANAGNVEGRFADSDLLLLTTTGFRSGQLRVTPLSYFTFDGKMIVVGSYGGVDVHPSWVHNLRAEPLAQVELGTTGHDVFARELPAAERDESFARVVAAAPRFGAYRAKTRRHIPLFELRRL
jgi:deazaflavin-dependent oxidoreductase (nitroreductase family)